LPKVPKLRPDALHMCSYRQCSQVEAKKGSLKKCTGCGEAWYCSKECQKADYYTGHALCAVKRLPKSEWGVGQVVWGSTSNVGGER
jgi:hypothetical protein